MAKRRRRRKQQQRRDYQAPIIKFSAVFAAVTRWTGALLAGEGFTIPDEWLVWWIPASAFLSAFMAVVEGWAFAYIFGAWWSMRERERRQKSGNMSSALLILTVLGAVMFILVLTPYIAAKAQGSSLHQIASSTGEVEPILNSKALLIAWSACVAASTISIVASVGIAQGARVKEVESMRYDVPELQRAQKGLGDLMRVTNASAEATWGRKPSKLEPPEVVKGEDKALVCRLCGQNPVNMQEHLDRHIEEIQEAGNIPVAVRVLTERYGQIDMDVLAEWQRYLSPHGW